MGFKSAGYEWEWTKKKQSGVLSGTPLGRSRRTSLRFSFPIPISKAVAKLSHGELIPKIVDGEVILRTEFTGPVRLEVSWAQKTIEPTVSEFIP